MRKLLLSGLVLFPILAFAQGATSPLERIGFAGAQGAVVGITLALLGLAIFFVIKLGEQIEKTMAPKMRKIGEKVRSVGKAAVKTNARIVDRTKTEEEKLSEIEDKFFEAAADEIENSIQKPGVWAKALALAEGDDKKQIAIYVRLRAKQLSKIKPRGKVKPSSEVEQGRKVEPPKPPESMSEVDLVKEWHEHRRRKGLPPY